MTVAWPLAFLGQAPIGAITTPRAISSVTRARAVNWPRSLKTRTYCPVGDAAFGGVVRVHGHRLFALHAALRGLVAGAGVEVGM